MSFRFAALLKLRKSLEHQQELRLRSANQWVGRLRELMRLTEAGVAALVQMQEASLSMGVAASEMHFMCGQSEALALRRRELGQQLAQAERIRDQQHQILFRIREQREMLESLELAEERERLRRASRREQRQLDEAFLLRQSRPEES